MCIRDRSPTAGQFGPVHPVEAVVRAHPIDVRAGIAYGPSGDALEAPVVDFAAADGVFRWVFIDLAVEDVIAGEVGADDELTIEVPLVGIGAEDGLGRLERSVADAASGVFFVSTASRVLDDPSHPADQLLADGM